MAVQAQYPSNLLLNRTGQEANEYSSQQSPQGGVFLDQSHLLFNNNQGINLNARKRERENISGIFAANTPVMNLSPSLAVAPPHQFMIDLSQLHNLHHQQPNNGGINVSTGLHLHHHYHQQQQNNLSSSSSLLLEEFLPQFKRQRDELDNFLQTQGEQLRHALDEKSQRHYRILLNAAEESVARRFREKEVEVLKATRHNTELEARAAQLTVKAQIWQANARAQEAAAASLQAQLQQAIASGGGGGSASAAQEHIVEEDAESAYVDPDRVTELLGPSCKECRKRVATVVLLPCRHLCLCTDCDQRVQNCPLCLCIRNSSVEVYLS